MDDDELVPLPQAARMLGTTSENLRKRLQRGLTIRGLKRGNAWLVHRADVEREVRAAGPATSNLAPASGAAGVNVQSSAIAALERELGLTRELLEAERRRADRLDVLLAEERQASAELRRLLARALGEGTVNTDA